MKPFTDCLLNKFSSSNQSNFPVDSSKSFNVSEVTHKCSIVLSHTQIPANFSIGPIPPSFKFLKNFPEEVNFAQQRFIHVRLMEDGNIQDQFNSSQWIEHLSAARDCTEQNLVYELRSNGFYLRTTRPISSGQRLLVWFSEAFTLQANLPFLTLDQIKGHRQYRCSSCYTIFSFPNMLKAHLLLTACSRDSKHLPSNFSVKPPVTDVEPPFIFPSVGQNGRFPWNYNTAPNEKRLTIFPFMNAMKRNLDIIDKLDSEKLSSMKDLSVSRVGNNKFPSSLTNNLSNITSAVKSVSHDLPTLQGNTEPLDLIPRSLYSNKNQKGHLCIYCGKLYSRKYGLKIHLRTHTGYKPLKCKICFRPFGDPSNLNKHVRLHAEGDTPYRCEFCGKVLVRRRDLDRHIKSRHFNQSRPLIAPTTTAMKIENKIQDFNFNLS